MTQTPGVWYIHSNMEVSKYPYKLDTLMSDAARLPLWTTYAILKQQNSD